jgi:hypothetical protein
VRRRYLFAVATAAALAAFVVPSAATAAPFAGVGRDAAAACTSGTLLTAVSAQRLPAGATAYKYVMPNGTTFLNTAPPGGFNAATASNALLAELHLPARPAGVTASAAVRKTWQAQVAPFSKSRISASNTFCVKAPAPEMPAATPGAATAGRRPAGVKPLGSVGHTPSTIWSGYELRSGTYHRAVGHFTQPQTNSSARSASTWIGLNSASNGRLVQAGAGDGDGSPGGNLFWELYCSPNPGDCNGPVISQYVAYPGDDVSVNVSYDNSHESYYQVAVNGALDINASRAMRSDSSTGAVADFITERTGGDQLPFFYGPIVFSGARTYALWGSDTSVPFGSQNYYAYEMTSDGNYHAGPCSASLNILMFPEDVTSGGFQNTFCADN